MCAPQVSFTFEGVLMGILVSIFGLVLLLPLCVFILAASFLLLFCFTCCYFSALVFESQFVQHLCKFEQNFDSEDDEFSGYISIDDRSWNMFN